MGSLLLMGLRKVLKSSNLLQVRELHGRSIISNKCRCSFKKEYQKLKASHPMVCKYNNTIDVADSALEQLYGITQTPKGLELKNFLLTGSMNGHISLYDVATAGRYSNYMSECMPKSIWPLRKSKAWQDSAVASIWCLMDPQIFSSRISCIKRFSWNNRALYPNRLLQLVFLIWYSDLFEVFSSMLKSFNYNS
ncbi:hypothetical protein Cni_G08450 [Canna indica]|uniref:Uncharacterized protein n=1 Tax=Canna indica TaxID=4628 RepID=A0AAQ3K0N2_9LILI|nr:hypothetical protein Cni_G08450 [Canna indica]